MGRVKPVIIKSNAKKIFTDNKDSFSNDFEKNKQILKELATIPSKVLRNRVAGHITRLKKITKEWEVM